MFDILKRYSDNTDILILVFHVLQYLVRDKPDRIRLTDSSLSQIIACLRLPSVAINLKAMLAITHFLCALSIPDQDLHCIASSALLQSLLHAAGALCYQDKCASDMEEEKESMLLAYRQHSVVTSSYHLSRNVSSQQQIQSLEELDLDTSDDLDSEQPEPIRIKAETSPDSADIYDLFDSVVLFQFNLALRRNHHYLLCIGIELPDHPGLRRFFLRCANLICDSLLRILRCDITCRRIMRSF